MTSQNSSPVQQHLRRHDVRFGRDLTWKSNQIYYINAVIFLDDIKIVFLPYLVSIRDLAACVEEVVVFLVENCSVHAVDNVIRLLTEASVCVITFAPH
jgi:hypothetical protein